MTTEELNPLAKIGRKSPVSRVADSSQEVSEKTHRESGAGSADKVSFSPASRELNKSLKADLPAPEIRYDLVNKYRAILSSGDYKVKAEELAEKMVQKIRERKNPTLPY